ncbi:MAG TPA: PKD domain-containing protein [Flavisolibacter sp.]|nr:PKD domain-containing protein [Flavisolibacter sp.]
MLTAKTIRWVSCFLVSTFFCFSAFSQTMTAKTSVSMSSRTSGYWEYLPANYASNTSASYPLIIYVHGAGSYGNGTASSLNLVVRNEGLPYYIYNNQFPSSFTVNGQTSSFIVIAPQFSSKAAPVDIKNIIDYVTSRYRVDLARIYLTGYSVGGDVAWKAPFNLTAAYRLAGLAPVAAYLNPYVDTTAQFIGNADLPVWAIHSNNDAAIPVTTSQQMVNKINTYNPSVPAIITRLNGTTHDNTTLVAYDPQFKPNGKNLYEWFLQYNRNYPPAANAGNDATITLPVNSVSLDGSSSTDPEGGPLSYSWTKTSGPSQFSFGQPSGASTTVSNLVAGTYQFRLTVTDNANITASDEVRIIVINPNPNQLPIAAAGAPQTILLPQTSVTLDGSGSSDPDGVVESYAWTKISGPASFSITAAGSSVTSVTNLRTGSYRFRLTVTDNQGGTASSNVDVTVVNPFPNVLPEAKAGADQTIELPTNSVGLSGASSTDADGAIVAYAWRQVSGPSQSLLSASSSANTTAGNLVLGTYQFELLVTDDSTGVDKDTVQVIVNPIPPVVTKKFIRVNLFAGSNPAGAGWTNWNVQAGLNSPALTYSDGTASAVRASLSNHSGTGDNGAGYPTVMCPPEVGRAASYSTASRTLVITGLDNSKRYDLEAYASRIGGNPTKFTIGNSSVTINTDRNYVNKASFTNLTPSAGKITMNIDLTLTFNYLNGFVLTENTLGQANASPVAATGPDQTILLPASEATLNGSGSYDPDGTIIAYNWQKLSGPSASIASPTSASTAVSGLTAGSYVFQLTVTDNLGYTASKTVSIQVMAAVNVQPSANAGPDQSINAPVSTVTLTGSGTDSDGSIAGYAWTKISGSGTIANPSQASTTVNGLTPGTSVFRLTVTDDKGATATDDITITVVAQNVPPQANAGEDRTITLPANSLTLTGLGTDSDGSIAGYAWTKTSGGAATIQTPGAASTQVTGLAQGVYVFTLTVTDDKGATAVDAVQVTVNAQAPGCPAKTIVILGSSTAAGTGATSTASSWVGLFDSHVRQANSANRVINLAMSSQTTYHLLPTGTVPPPNRPAPHTANNITAALANQPHAIIINMPSNDAGNGYTLQEQQANFEIIAAAATAAGVPVWITTTQPRSLDAEGRGNLAAMRDWIFATYGAKAIDVWTGLANADGTINAAYALGDGIHINNAGHALIYQRVLTRDILPVLCGAPNQSPSANAGNDQSLTLPTNFITLTGTGADSDGSVNSYAWSKISGGAATIVNSTLASTAVNGLTQGSYVFRLTVTDNRGATSTDDVTVTVNAQGGPLTGISGLALHYTFDEAELNWASATAEVIDQQGDSDGDAIGFTSSHIANGKIGQALSFGGTRYIASTQAAALLVPTASYTVSLWMNAPAVGGNMTLFGKATTAARESQLLLNTNSSLSSFAGGENNTALSPAVPTNQWVHLVLVNNAATNTQAVYMNGVLVKSFASGYALANGIDMLVGARRNNSNTDATGFYAGLMDDYRIYNRALSVDEINLIYNLNDGGTVEPPANKPPVASAGNGQTIRLPVNSVTLDASASTDPDGTITSYSWTRQSGPGSFTLSNAGVAKPVAGGLAEGTHVFRVTVTNNAGATASAEVSVVVQPAITGAVTKYVRVNLFGGANPYSNAEWNNWNLGGTNIPLPSGALKYSDGSASTITASLNQQTMVTDNGAAYNTTMCPAQVGRYTSYSTSNRTLVISGLNSARQYDLALFASRASTASGITQFTIGGVSVNIATDNNSANAALFNNLVPVNGQITITITRLNTFNYLNGFTLTEKAAPAARQAATVNPALTAAPAPTVPPLQLFPNPASDRLLVSISNELKGQAVIRLFDAQGAIKRSVSVRKAETGTMQAELSLQSLTPGLYTLRVSMEGWEKTIRVLKQ